MVNKNKTVHSSGNQITVYYTDSKKHFVIPYPASPLEKIQLFGNTVNGKSVQDQQTQIIYESDEFSPYQTKLYKEVMHGLSIYPDNQVKQMPFREKMKIINTHKRTQQVLNLWKQSIVNPAVDKFLLALFPRSKAIKAMIEETRDVTDPTVTNYQSFSDLGITKVQIARKLVEAGILPETFFTPQLSR
jgi:hypothetical protein